MIEAATGNVDLKVRILQQLDALVAPDVIIASNTSSISITRLAATVARRPLHRNALLRPRANDGPGGNHPGSSDQ